MTKIRYSLGRVEDLGESEVKILKGLLSWNYGFRKANYFNIAMLCKISTSHVAHLLRVLQERGLVKSSGGSWHINKKIQPLLIEEQIKEGGDTDGKSDTS